MIRPTVSDTLTQRRLTDGDDQGGQVCRCMRRRAFLKWLECHHTDRLHSLNPCGGQCWVERAGFGKACSLFGEIRSL